MRGLRRSSPGWTRPPRPGETVPMLIAQLSDVHVGGSRYREELLRAAIEEINTAAPDLVVVAGDPTDEGYPDQYPLAKEELSALACPLTSRIRALGHHRRPTTDRPARLLRPPASNRGDAR